MKKLTQAEFLKRIKDMYGDTLTILSDFKTTKDPVKVRCNIHNVEYMYQPTHLFQGKRGCKLCRYGKVSKTLTHDTQWLKDIIKQYAPNQYEVLGEYQTFDTKIKIKHNKCGKVFEVRPNAFYQTIKKGKVYCPYCHNNKPLDYETVKHNIEQAGKGDYELVSKEYVNNVTPLQVKHLACGHIYPVRYADFMNGNRCPFCKKNLSHGEKYLIKYLDNHHINYEYQKRFDNLKDKKYLSYDFYLPDYNLLIEYQGEQHYHLRTWGDKSDNIQSHLTYVKKHDKMKADYAKDNGYQLLTIACNLNTQAKIDKFMDNFFSKEKDNDNNH